MRRPEPGYACVPASPFPRLAARLIDFILAVPFSFVATIPALPLVLPFAPLLGGLESEAATTTGAAVSLFLSYVVVEVVSVRAFGKTLGKKLVGIEVVPVGPEKKLTLAKSLLRWFLVSALWWVNVYLVGGRGTAIHDIAAGTRVVRVFEESYLRSPDRRVRAVT
jgi:uncharacterized RDD family membrane protein YckC